MIFIESSIHLVHCLVTIKPDVQQIPISLLRNRKIREHIELRLSEPVLAFTHKDRIDCIGQQRMRICH
ncbi:hypothetical protein D3C75_1245930 [compost metagenome]